MSYLKPVVVASTMLVASLSATTFAGHMNYAAVSQPSAATNLVVGVGRNSPVSDVSCFNWEKRIFVGGLLNVDTVYSERGWADAGASVIGGASDFETPPFSSHSVHGSDIVVNNANLLFDAKVNSATTAHVGIAYVQRPGEFGSDDLISQGFVFGVPASPVSSDVHAEQYWGGYNSSSPASFFIDEAYITFHDCSSPFYFQAGKKFTSFSDYNPYPITYSLTQLLAQTNEEVLEFGYMTNDGLRTSIYAFNGPLSGMVTNASNLTSRINNYGIDVNYASQYDNINYTVGAGYVKDIRDSSYLSHRISNNQVLQGFASSYLVRNAGGYALHGHMNNGPFVLSADYVAALRQLLDTVEFADDIGVPEVDTRVWAYGLQAGYGFDSMGYASNASLGYQRSGNGSMFGLARYRILADYTVEVSKYAKVTLQYTHSRDYKASDIIAMPDENCNYEIGHATNNTTNTATLRIGVAI